MNKTNEVKIPVYQLIRNKLIEELSLNKFKPGDTFYTERDLIEKFAASKMTVRSALRYLEDEGYISRRQGAGAFVASIPDKPHKMKITDHCSFSIIPGKRGFREHMPFVRFLMYMHDHAYKKGYMLYLGNDDVMPFIKAQVEGIVLLGPLEDEQLKKLEHSQIPVVSVFHKYRESFSSVLPNFRQEGYDAYKYLFSLGHRNVVLLGHGNDAELVRKSIQPGISDVLNDLKLPKESCRTMVNKNAYDIFKNELLEKKTDAVILMNGSAIVPALKVINECGLKVPADISILVHGEKATEMITSPPLSIIRHDYNRAAEATVEILEQIFSGKTPEDILYSCHILERGSCTCRNV